MEVKLSILIATMPARALMFGDLMRVLSHQLTSDVEVCVDACLDYNIGVKRNKLLAQAKGQYIVFIDDDDEISPDYVSLILKALETSPDCLGISGVISTNGVNKRYWHISINHEYWFERAGIYYRTPNHISPVKRELALKAGFPEIAFGEDAEYSKRLLPYLVTEVVINELIYHYKYISDKDGK